jgi:hypothetical protein
MIVVVDTNVLIVANERESPQASPACVTACVEHLQAIKTGGLIVFDQQWHILKEYMKKVSPTGQPSVGDDFLEWILKNQGNPQRCQLVNITLLPDGNFAEFPQDPELSNFDPSDRKFVAVALAYPKPEKPSISNAVDSDWLPVQPVLLGYGITLNFLCPEHLNR